MREEDQVATQAMTRGGELQGDTANRLLRRTHCARAPRNDIHTCHCEEGDLCPTKQSFNGHI